MPVRNEQWGRSNDGSAADADYGVIGPDCAKYRGPEPRFAQAVRVGLGGAVYVADVAIDRLAADLGCDRETGMWDAQHAHLRTQAEYESSLRLITVLR
jgi:hypothetical protein